jgi:hypothetical protein
MAVIAVIAAEVVTRVVAVAVLIHPVVPTVEAVGDPIRPAAPTVEAVADLIRPVVPTVEAVADLIRPVVPTVEAVAGPIRLAAHTVEVDARTGTAVAVDALMDTAVAVGDRTLLLPLDLMDTTAEDARTDMVVADPTDTAVDVDTATPTLLVTTAGTVTAAATDTAASPLSSRRVSGALTMRPLDFIARSFPSITCTIHGMKRTLFTTGHTGLASSVSGFANRSIFCQSIAG